MRFLTQLLSLILAPVLAVGPLCAQSEGPGGSELEIHVVETDGVQVPAGSHSSKGFTVLVTDASGAPVSEAAVVVRLPESGPTGAFKDGTHSAVAYTDGAGRANVSEIDWSADPGAMTVKITATKGIVHTGTLVEQSLTSGSATTRQSPPIAPPPAVQKPNEPSVSTLPPPVRAPSLQASPMQSPAPIARLAPASEARPAVSVTTTPRGEKVHSGSSKTKWIILAVVAAGAGAGVAMMGHGKSSSTSTATTGVSIGTPTVSVGAP